MSEQFTIAMRVLRAVSNRERPDESDVARLRMVAGFEVSHLDADELACIVINEEYSQRTKAARRGS